VQPREQGLREPHDPHHPFRDHPQPKRPDSLRCVIGLRLTPQQPFP
jgi:hypothetical protein